MLKTDKNTINKQNSMFLTNKSFINEITMFNFPKFLSIGCFPYFTLYFWGGGYYSFYILLYHLSVLKLANSKLDNILSIFNQNEESKTIFLSLRQEIIWSSLKISKYDDSAVFSPLRFHDFPFSYFLSIF